MSVKTREHPFVLGFVSQSTGAPEVIPHLRYSSELQRNQALIGAEWVDVTELPDLLSGAELVTMTRGATMTSAGGNGGYKLDDDNDY